MPNKFLLHTILLIASTAGVYLWLTSPFEPFTLQLVAVLSLIYVSVHYFKQSTKYTQISTRSTIPFDLTLLTVVILLLVTDTGALTSPFFFLLFFLAFAVSMLYEIEATLILTGTLIIYLALLPTTDLTNPLHLSQLIALLMITPLAIFTGHKYEEVVDHKRAKLKLQKHLGHIETDTLIFLALNLKQTLLKSLDSLSTTIPLARAKDVKNSLENLYKDLKVLYRSSLELERAVDKETD